LCWCRMLIKSIHEPTFIGTSVINLSGRNVDSEVKLLWEIIKPRIYDPTLNENQDPLVFKPKPIFQQNPHFTFDNYFSGDDIMNYAANEKIGLTMTC
jgi:hypothetical protein